MIHGEVFGSKFLLAIVASAQGNAHFPPMGLAQLTSLLLFFRNALFIYKTIDKHSTRCITQ